MKRLLLILLISIAGSLQAQDWQSVRLNTTLGIFAPYDCFKLNPYTNDLWFCSSEMVASLNHDGSVLFMDMADISEPPYKRDIAFTPNHVYFLNESTGLYRINSDFSKMLVLSDNNLRKAYSNGDTVYAARSDDFVKYTSMSTTITDLNFDKLYGKGANFYPANTPIYKYTGQTSDGYEPYFNLDPEIICNSFHDAKFSRLTDTFYVSCTQGITKAINYDFNDSIVPSNTINMPSANVIEFEFDDQDRLWAVFGDANDVPFAFARLDGNEWTNRYDASNCPINFAAYKGLEIDTLGNLWVSESFYLHTLLTPNSPVWLGTQELALETLEAYPNPAAEQVTIKLPNAGGRLQVAGLSGVVLLEEKVITEQELSLDISSWRKGCYVATWMDGDRRQQVLIVK